MSNDLVEMARLAQHDERMATGALYGDLADHIEELEAKLAKAVEALEEAWFMLTVPHLNYEPEPEEPGLRLIKSALIELRGKTDD